MSRDPVNLPYPLPEGMAWAIDSSNDGPGAWDEELGWWHAWVEESRETPGYYEAVFDTHETNERTVPDEAAKHLFPTQEEALQYISTALMMGLR